MLVVQLISLLAALRAISSSQYYVINQGLNQLDDWLEENVQSREPKENLEAILKEFSNRPENLLNRSKLTAVKFLQVLKEAVENGTSECTRAHLDLIRMIQKSGHAYSSMTLLRTDTILRPYALTLVDKCDQLHEREFERIHSQNAPELRPLERRLNEGFIELHRKKFSDGSPLHFRDDHFPRRRCCTPVLDELADLIRLESIKLNPNERSADLIAPLVERRFEPNLGRHCSKYLELLGDTFELAISASYFDSAKDLHFIAKRSHAYQSAVFRYKFCQHVLKERSRFIEELAGRLINEREPAKSGVAAGGK